MITIITGDNTFESERKIQRIIGSFKGVAEIVDGSELELKQLPDLLMGTTLFADKRLVIIKNLSENKNVWTSFGDWLSRVSDDIEVVLIEPKPDKRTTTYKDLKKQAQIVEVSQWTDRNTNEAEKWVLDEAKRMEVGLDVECSRLLVRRVGLDQWQLYHALEKLALVEEVTVGVIESIIDANPVENVFNLFDAALRGDKDQVTEMIRTLEMTEDPYRLFALLSGQAFQLAAVVAAGSSDNVAKDFGLHPYAVSKLTSAAKRQGRGGVKKIIKAFAEADDDMKLSRADPWLLVERSLMKVASK
ncbi:DNA polymerase III subunit delta [Candidatus Saccharibacteria bacterium]|nr:DNA polymerase III subunit delta [Candidatus Saccharibacteria bacterium]